MDEKFVKWAESLGFQPTEENYETFRAIEDFCKSTPLEVGESFKKDAVNINRALLLITPWTGPPLGVVEWLEKNSSQVGAIVQFCYSFGYARGKGWLKIPPRGL